MSSDLTRVSPDLTRNVDVPLDRASLASDVLAVGALTVYSVTTATSFAALVFSGPVAGGLPRGATAFILASGIMTVVIGLRTTFPLAFAGVQDTAAIVLVPAIAVLVDRGSDDPVRDTFVVLAGAALITGAAMWVIGRTGLGAAARFVPTTVVAGFLAGTGWLLTKGGFDLMTGRSLGLGDVSDLFDPDVMKFWLPGAALGLVVAVVPLTRQLPPYVSSLATIGSAAGFFVVVAVASSLSAVENDGWLLGPFAGDGSAQLVVSDVANADWSAVAGTGGQIGVVLILSLFGVMLNLTGIQALVRHRADVDAELRSMGVANIITAPFGGLVGYHALGDSALAHRLDVDRRWVPTAVGLGTVVFAVVGARIVGYLPVFVAGGLLIGAGLGLLIGWARELLTTATWFDRSVGILIVATIAFVGILEGITIGLIAAFVFFVVGSSRIDAIRVVSDGHERRSVVERSAHDTKRLDDVADRLAVYELHGPLFFGSVTGVADTIRRRLAHPDPPAAALIVDFDRVTDIDSSAFAALVDLAREVAATPTLLVWSALDKRSLERLGRIDEAFPFGQAPDLDAALEVAEDHLLQARPGVVGDEPSPAAAVYSADLLEWFDARSYDAGEVILAEGEPSEELILIVTGSIHVSRRDRNGDPIRLRTLRAGAIVGEIGFLTDEVRSATVTAESDVALQVLDAETHRRLRVDRPDLAIELYDRVLRSTAGRAAAIHRSLTQALR